MIEIEQRELNPTKVKVIGIGGGGGNVIDRMVEENIVGLDFVAINTDLQALSRSKASTKIQIGVALTKGLGAGATPDVGRKAAEESLEEIREILKDVHMVFITAGMGGGTGTGASPVVAALAKEMGILTIGVVTKPFEFEGMKRMAYAKTGIEELSKYIDTLIMVPNENLLKVFGSSATVMECFRQADKVLMQGVKAISELVVLPGIINVDFSDLKTVMKNKGHSIMGMATAIYDKSNFSVDTLVSQVVENPLLERTDVMGARGILINIKSGKNIPLSFVNNFSKSISSRAHVDADIVIGMVLDETNDNAITVTLIATGIDDIIDNVRRPIEFSDKDSIEKKSMFNDSPKEKSSTPTSTSTATKKMSIFDRTPSAVSNENPQRKQTSFDENLEKSESLSTSEERVINEPFLGKGEYIDVQNIEVPTFLRKKNK